MITFNHITGALLSLPKKELLSILLRSRAAFNYRSEIVSLIGFVGVTMQDEPNTLIYIDWPSTDPEAAGAFYHAVFGWEHDARLGNSYARVLPGGFFRNPDGSISEVKHLHMGIYNPADPIPNPVNPAPALKPPSPYIAAPRVYVLVSRTDSVDRILDTAAAHGAVILWRDHHWPHFKGFAHAFRDPWGLEVILWEKVGETPEVPPHFTVEESRAYGG